MVDVVFKNTKVIFREELFGGIAQYNSQLFYLNKVQFKLLSEFKGFKQYSFLPIDEKEIIDEFLKHDIFLKICKD
ncbi:hypothetical protein GQR60_06285 [Labilibaculum sp. A4]|uniref:hypothetical protein n=1 Tax=Labilibaculum euxinus TaxID=2686357 RepID=UPI000F621C32|nr:hypothetical protein [Labilibaculum euxinus]MDQ1770768.1 hypothetical protein [Labilibaculum euxinus]MWN75938.1 hypothetical protein [Labilibaculum euxinus]